jgi:PPOX class probable F420-dependent enzyme
MTQFDPALESVLAAHSLGVLATIRRGGRPQLSTVLYHYDRESRTARFSLTADRAKVKNLQRDPRATLHVTGDSRWQWAAADGDARLTPVTQGDDATMADLEDLYRTAAGEHPDWAEFRRDMVAQRRLVLHLTMTHVYGMSP